MSYRNATLGHHLDEVTGAELERQVPPDAQDDDFLVEMSTPEEIFCGGRFRHPSRYRRELSLSSLHQNPPIKAVKTLKPLRMSQLSSSTKILRLPLKLNIFWLQGVPATRRPVRPLEHR